MTRTLAIGYLIFLLVLAVDVYKINQLRNNLAAAQSNLAAIQTQNALLRQQITQNETALKALEQARQQTQARTQKARATIQAAKSSDDGPLAPVVKQALEALHD